MSTYPAIRCASCHARLFDTSGRESDGPDVHIEIHIRCWRCKAVVRVRLVAPGLVREAQTVENGETRAVHNRGNRVKIRKRVRIISQRS